MNKKFTKLMKKIEAAEESLRHVSPEHETSVIDPETDRMKAVNTRGMISKYILNLTEQATAARLEPPRRPKCCKCKSRLNNGQDPITKAWIYFCQDCYNKLWNDHGVKVYPTINE